MAKKPIQTFWLDQGEFLGGAERFSLDFFARLNRTEKRRLNLTVLGAEEPKYRAMLPDDIPAKDLDFPSVGGNFLKKFLAAFSLFFKAAKLRNFVEKSQQTQWVTNTPRGHFLLFLAKTFWRLPGRWTAIFHDFTTRPQSLLSRICRRADILIANSLPTRAYLRAALPKAEHTKIRIVENGIDVDKIPEGKTPASIERILHIGRIDPRKGQLHTAEAADLLLERNPELKFTIVGSSVEQDPRTLEYDAQIQAFVQSRQLKNLKFKAEVNDPFTEINQYDALLVLSTEAETFGRIAIEGLVMNKLVIAFDQTGPREILSGYHRWLIKQGYIEKNTPNPLLIEANNSMTLAETVAYFADNPKAAAPYTAHAREFVRQNYNLAETTKRLVEILSA